MATLNQRAIGRYQPPPHLGIEQAQQGLVLRRDNPYGIVAETTFRVIDEVRLHLECLIHDLRHSKLPIISARTQLPPEIAFVGSILPLFFILFQPSADAGITGLEKVPRLLLRSGLPAHQFQCIPFPEENQIRACLWLFIRTDILACQERYDHLLGRRAIFNEGIPFFFR